jgi:hypothetical protein
VQAFGHVERDHDLVLFELLLALLDPPDRLADFEVVGLGKGLDCIIEFLVLKNMRRDLKPHIFRHLPANNSASAASNSST